MNTPPPRLGSLFSGIGGLDLAIEEYYGAETAWHCQYDPEDRHQYAAQVLAQHWPSVPNLGDITAVDWDQVEPVDILAGGFPCTDVSLAGKRAGLNNQTRSGLWAHMAQAIHALRPRLVVIENVRGLLSAPAHTHGHLEPCTWCMGDTQGEPVLRALGAVLGDLAELGFDAEWVGLPASDIGAPHQRWREFILAWPAHAQGPRLEEWREGRPGRIAEAAEDPDVAARGQRRLAAPGQAESRRPRADARGRSGAPAAHTSGERHGHPGTAGERGVPAAPVAGRPAAAADTVRDAVRQQPVGKRGSRSAAIAGFAGSEAPTDAPGDGRQQGRAEPARQQRRSDSAVGGAPDWGPFEPAIRRWELVLDRPAPRPVDDRGRLSPDLPEWMMGYPAGWTVLDQPPAGMTDSQIRNARLKACGNGVVPQQALAALSLLHRAATSTASASAA